MRYLQSATEVSPERSPDALAVTYRNLSGFDIEARGNYSDVMSETGQAQSEHRSTLEEFFAATMQPTTEQSSFTPAQVAELIRRDRDASQ